MSAGAVMDNSTYIAPLFSSSLTNSLLIITAKVGG